MSWQLLVVWDVPFYSSIWHIFNTVLSKDHAVQRYLRNNPALRHCFPFVMYFSHLSQIWLGFALWPKFSFENTLAFLNPEHRPCINHGADDWWVSSTNQNKPLSSLYSALPGLSGVHKGEKTSCTQPTWCKPGYLRQEGLLRLIKDPTQCPGKCWEPGGAGLPGMPCSWEQTPNELTCRKWSLRIQCPSRHQPSGFVILGEN